MGLFRANGVVHKPVENVNLGPDDEYYLQASVKGSVKMPEALCGVVGFRPTFGRVPHSGVLPLNWTVGTVGVLTGTIEVHLSSKGILTSHSSNQHIQCQTSHWQDMRSGSVIAVMIFEHAVPKHCTSFLRSLGGRTVNVTIPDIESMRLAHYITIGCDCTAALSSYLEKLSRQMQFHRNIFTKADVIVTPTVGVTAYPNFYDDLKTGELDYINGAAPVRYQIAGNFLGLPAVGYDKKWVAYRPPICRKAMV